MKTIKEYAESVGKTREAVYKQLKAKKNQERLKGHVWQQSGSTYLDDVAIEILNESRKVTQVKQDQQLKSENERMTKEIDDLKNKIINLQDELKVKTEQMATMLIENKEKTLLLEKKEDQTNRIQELQQDKLRLQAEVDRLKVANDQLSANAAPHSQSESHDKPKKGFLARLFGR